MWAWGVKAKRVPRTVFFLDPNDEAAEAYHELHHQQCILPLFATPPTPGGNPPNFNIPPINLPPPVTTGAAGGQTTDKNDAILQQLAVGITRQSENQETHNQLLAKQLEHSLEKEDKKKDRLKKFHSSIKQMILFASAEDADDLPDDVHESCRRFFNAETVINAEQELTLQFSNKGMQDAQFAHGFINSIYAGKFAWNKNFTPSNFSPFMIYEAEPLLAANQSSRHLILHLEDTNGKSSEEVSVATTSAKHSVKAPTTYHEMIQQLKYFQVACTVFFGEKSIASVSLTALIQLVELNKHIFKSCEVDKEFMSKFLFAIDKRFQLWLESCTTLPNRAAVDDSVLHFRPLVQMVQYSTFNLTLPLTFTKATEKTEPATKSSTKNGNKGGGGGGGDDPSNGDNEGQNPNKKRKKSEKVTNKHQPEQFKMKTGETWQTTFAHKDVRNRVPWEGDVKMCPRWFIGGYCFANCFHKSSHVKDTDIPADKLAAFKSFLDNIRGD